METNLERVQAERIPLATRRANGEQLTEAEAADLARYDEYVSWVMHPSPGAPEPDHLVPPTKAEAAKDERAAIRKVTP